MNYQGMTPFVFRPSFSPCPIRAILIGNQRCDVFWFDIATDVIPFALPRAS